MPAVSVIIPIYNVEAWLPRCLDSILAQTFADFEAILIDDGSPDNCASIIDTYARNDDRFIPLHQANKGVSAARNAGLQLAKGKYISFVDPDDWVDTRFLEQLVLAAEKNKVDIVCCNWDAFSDTTGIPHEVPIPTGKLTGAAFERHIYDSPRTLGGSNCNKLFIKEKITFPFNESLNICEDNVFLQQYCADVSAAYFIDVPMYHIFERSDSATRGVPAKLIGALPVREELVHLVREENRSYVEADYLDTCYGYYRRFNSDECLRRMRCFIVHNLCRFLFNGYISIKLKVIYLLQIMR